MIMYYIITIVTKAIKNNSRLVTVIPPIRAQFTQLEASKSALMSLAASPTACWPPSSGDSQHLSGSQGSRPSLLHGWATAAAVCCIWSPGSRLCIQKALGGSYLV